MRRLSCSALGVAVLGVLGLGMAGCEPMPAMTVPAAVEVAEDSSPSQQSVYQRYDVSWGTAHVVVVPPGGEVAIAASTDLQPLSAFVNESGSDFAINAGFFDPQNGKTTSHLIVNSEVVGDPANNERLVGNPDLAPYLPQILNRSEFRIYRCASGQTRYDIALHDAPVLADCEIESAVGAGPQLLPEDTSQLEAFTDYADGELIRDAIGSVQPNARSAVGLDAQGAVYLIMAEKNAGSTGARLSDMADFAADLGVTQLLNLDGGSSSGLYAQPDQFYFGRTDAEGNPIERPIKSAIVVGDGSAENE